MLLNFLKIQILLQPVEHTGIPAGKVRSGYKAVQIATYDGKSKITHTFYLTALLNKGTCTTLTLFSKHSQKF